MFLGTCKIHIDHRAQQCAHRGIHGHASNNVNRWRFSLKNTKTYFPLPVKRVPHSLALLKSSQIYWFSRRVTGVFLLRLRGRFCQLWSLSWSTPYLDALPTLQPWFVSNIHIFHLRRVPRNQERKQYVENQDITLLTRVAENQSKTSLSGNWNIEIKSRIASTSSRLFAREKGRDDSILTGGSLQPSHRLLVFKEKEETEN